MFYPHHQQFSSSSPQKKKGKEKCRLILLCVRAEKLGKHEVDGDNNGNFCPRNGPQKPRKRIDEIWDFGTEKGTSRPHLY